MVLLKFSQNSQENLYSWVSFVIKLKTGGLQLNEMETLVRVFSCEFYETLKKIYFVKVCDDLFLKSKIFTWVSFRKILGFDYKQNRELFYHERTSPYIPLKNPELAKSVISQNSPDLLPLKIP